MLALTITITIGVVSYLEVLDASMHKITYPSAYSGYFWNAYWPEATALCCHGICGLVCVNIVSLRELIFVSSFSS